MTSVETPCPICGAKMTEKTKGGVIIHRCPACGFTEVIQPAKNGQ